MATTNRVGPNGWIQGDDSATVSRVTPTGWGQVTAAGGGAQTLTPDLFTDGDTFHAATVSVGAVTLSPALYSDGDTFHDATVTLGGAAQSLTPDLFADGDTFHAATVAAGSVNLAPSLVTDDDTFYAASVSQGGATQDLTPALFIDAPHTIIARPDGTIDAIGFTPVGAATIHECLNEVTPNDSTYIVGTSDTVEVSLQDIADPGISTGHVVRFRAKADSGWLNILLLQGATTKASKQYFGTFPTAWTDDSFTLTTGEADSITDYSDLKLRFSGLVGNTYFSWAEFSVESLAGDAFHTATVAAGAVTLTPSLVSDGDTFYAHALVLEGGPQTLSPDLFADGDTFHAATVTPGAVTLTPSLYTDADTFHAAEIASGFNLQPPAYADPDTFYPATVARGAVSLAPSLFADGDAFHPPTVTFGQVLAPALFVDVDSFYAPVVFMGDISERLERIFPVPSERRIFTVASERRIFKD